MLGMRSQHHKNMSPFYLLCVITICCMLQVEVLSHECAGHLMDSVGVPIFDKSPLPEIEFDRISLTICSVNTVQIQIWEFDEDFKIYTLVYTNDISPSVDDVGDYSVQYEVKQHRIRPNSYMALLSSMSTKVPVPFVDTNNKPGSLWMSAHLPDRAYRIGTTLPIEWEDSASFFYRSFKLSVSYCDELSCEFVQRPVNMIGPQGEPGIKGDIGDPGDPGLPGYTCISGDQPVPINFTSARDLGEGIAEVQHTVDTITEVITNVEDALSNVTRRNPLVTGKCESGFLSSWFGIGFCYAFIDEPMMDFGGVGIYCWRAHRTIVLTIDNRSEERYLADMIMNATGIKGSTEERSVTVWTGGMYNSDTDKWIWYQEGSSDGSIDMASYHNIGYLNWYTDQPAPFTEQNFCIAFKVFNDGTFGWFNEDCSAKHNVICKQAKKCN